jgi:hypothetical protein
VRSDLHWPVDVNANSPSGGAARRATSFAPIAGRGLMWGMVWVGLALLVCLAWMASVQAQATGILEGKVVNGTPDGAEPGAGLPVVLYVYRGEVESDTLEATTDVNGRFRFEGLDTDATLEYWPEVVYQGVSYGSAEPLQFDGESATLTATLTVFETTDDDSMIRLDSVHIIAESFGQVLRISEIHFFGNSGERTYVGGGGGEDALQTTVFIPLPENAVGVASGEGVTAGRFVEVEGGLMDTEPVPPGTESSLAFFSYHLMVTGETVQLERRFAYPVTALNMLVAQPGLAVSSEQLQSRGVELFQGQQYELYATQSLSAGTPLLLEFVPTADAGSAATGGTLSSSGQGAIPAPSGGNQRLLLWIGVGLLAFALVGAVVYSLAAQRGPSISASAGALASDSRLSSPQAKRLLAKLADLEEDLESGRVNEATYEGQRAEIFEELRSL